MKKTYLSMAVAAALTLSACGGSDNNVLNPVTPVVTNAVALTTANELWLIDIANPDKVVKRMAVTGINSGEELIGIDYRPSNGMLYGITKSAVYVIDDTTGAVSGRQALVPVNSTLPFTAPLTGTSFGVDFNPVVDRLRVIDDTGMSLVVNVDTGAVNRQADIGTIGTGGTAMPPQPTGFKMTAAAYTNSISKPVSTRLWDIDTQGDRLFQQNAADNDSQLSGAVALGVDASDVNGFDIDGFNNKGYAALTAGGTTSLYAIDLAPTAIIAPATTPVAATLIKSLGSGMVPVKGITLKTKTTAAYALTDDGKILRFLPTAPQSASTADAKQITGLMPGSDTTAAETVLGIDFRPADGKLYGITSKSRIITINKATGAATVGGSLSLSLPTSVNTGTTAAPIDTPVTYSVDFNPAADKLRVMNTRGLNLRIDVDMFSTTIDGMLSKTYDMPAMGAAALPTSPQPISIVAAAYTNSFAPPNGTQLYDLDVGNQSLALQNANVGTFTFQGAIRTSSSSTATPPVITATPVPFDRASMDIVGGANGLPLIGLATGAAGTTSLYTVNLTSGVATAYPSATNTVGTGATAPVISDIALTLE
ncbi:uncharacterized protein DUF4394 [Paraperlucidibaca baekdonensis]|uniref:Uncharacterized protein DUF4394 n=1 Tax=Paraperlucidibaca baekdonensis TaxID=748120 RepID=A0A3E0H9K6_9GAMM|nr:DUF4394 domain-containing protein [Paraperlucidibaca baekdonensis]REH40210.1 uncharacterized protein DUF4394 [Paraperlucidibaca baekdonensis]